MHFSHSYWWHLLGIYYPKCLTSIMKSRNSERYCRMTTENSLLRYLDRLFCIYINRKWKVTTHNYCSQTNLIQPSKYTDICRRYINILVFWKSTNTGNDSILELYPFDSPINANKYAVPFFCCVAFFARTVNSGWSNNPLANYLLYLTVTQVGWHNTICKKWTDE